MNIGMDLTLTLGTVVTVALAIVGWVRVRNVAIEKRFEASSSRLDRHDLRIQKIEDVVKSLPGKDELHDLAIGISDLRGDMREMRMALQGQGQIMTRLEAVVSRQEDHLMRTK